MEACIGMMQLCLITKNDKVSSRSQINNIAKSLGEIYATMTSVLALTVFSVLVQSLVEVK